MNENIFISCGEVSGDIYAGEFIREYLKINPDAKIWGMLGSEGVKAGGEERYSYEELKLMGILEVIPALPRIFKLKNRIANEIVKTNPDAVVLIDSPDYHLMLAHTLRKLGYSGKIVSLIPPTVWAWRTGRVKNLKRDFDFCLPLFSFEHKFLISHDVNSFWKAHPLVHNMKNVKLSEAFMKRFGHERIIALMPGSRHYDIKHHLDTLIGTAEILRHEKKFLPVFSVAPGLSEELSDELMRRVNDSGFEFWNGEGRELMLGSCAVAGVSGTVAVEAMMLNRFMVVIYNMNRIIYAILKRIVHVKNISVPNMLTDKQIFPELLCDDATPANIVRELHCYLDDDVRRSEIDSLLDEAKMLMGEENAASFWADCIANM